MPERTGGIENIGFQSVVYRMSLIRKFVNLRFASSARINSVPFRA